MSLQLTLLAIALVYLVIRRFDFKQLPIRFNLGVLFWTPVIFILMGLTADAVTSLTAATITSPLKFSNTSSHYPSSTNSPPLRRWPSSTAFKRLFYEEFCSSAS